MNYDKLFRYTGFAAIALLLFGLGGWYLFLRQQTANETETAQNRGFSIGIPSFLGSRGSTAANIESGSSAGGAALSEFFGMGAQKNTATGEQTAAVEGDPRAPRLWRVSTTPVAGMSFVAGSTTRLRYIERSTGHIFDADPGHNNTQRITNTLITKSYVALVGEQSVLLQTLEDTGIVRTRAGKVSTTTQDGFSRLDTKDIALPMESIAITRTTSDFLTLVGAEVGSRLLRAGWDGGSPKQIAAIPAGDFNILWPSVSRIFLVERPASGIMGTVLAVTTSLTPRLSGLGLMIAPNPSNDSLLYSTDTGTLITLFGQPAGASAIPLPIRTIAEKCVWARADGVAYCAVPGTDPGTNFVDRWYRGEAHTEDSWYRVNVSAGTAEKMYSSDAAAIDVERPIIDDTDTYLSFMNARDKSLWMLRIKE